MRQDYAAFYSVKQIRALEQAAIQDFCIPEMILMERAGVAVLDALQTRWPEARHILVFCGAGNNGGDGYVAARLAHEAGLNVRVLSVGEPDNLTGAVADAREDCSDAGVAIGPYDAAQAFTADVVIDALLGLGLTREVRGDYVAAIDSINKLHCPVLAVDAPSGLDLDTGIVQGCAVKAEATVTFIGVKPGLETGQGPAYAGEVILDNLGLAKTAYANVTPMARHLTLAKAIADLPVQAADAHKGVFGHVLVIGGNYGFAGAVRMAAEAAARVGAGLVSVVTRPEHVPVVVTARPELMCLGVEHPHEADELIARADVIAIGPGLGMDAWAQGLLQKILATDKNLVVDADALNLLVSNPSLRDNWLLTPHPGEAGRLLGVDSKEVQQDRFTAVTQLQKRFGGSVVLKGAGTLVKGPASQSVGLCTAGNVGMASGGMGDVLTGICAGLVAQGLSLQKAADVGVTLHAYAGDLAAERRGLRSLMAMDVVAELRSLLC